MTGKHRIRVRLRDGKKLTYGKIKSQLGTELQVYDVEDGRVFVICATSQERLDRVRSSLGAAGLEEISGPTDVPAPTSSTKQKKPQHTSVRQRDRQPVRTGTFTASNSEPDLSKKPYAFIPLPDNLDNFSTREPVWHDGNCSTGRLSGEIRFEMTNLTPLLVGWERRKIADTESPDDPWPVPFTEDASNEAKEIQVNFAGVGRTVKSKPIICPLRAPWGERPVIIPGDTLKGLLRHELGALLGAPMERVTERSYSYRPNSRYPNENNPRLVPRLARVPQDGVDTREVKGVKVRVPAKLELLPTSLKYENDHKSKPPHYRFDPPSGKGAAYRGGLGAGRKLNSKKRLHSLLELDLETPTETANVPVEVQQSYVNTLLHLVDTQHGHFSERHPDVPETIKDTAARDRILEQAENLVFSPGDLIWVEWDTQNQKIVSFGWHYYYRWVYQDTVRRKGWADDRLGLYTLAAEKVAAGQGDEPASLSPVRRLFGYTGDNEGSAGIGKKNFSQLMGRISINAALEIVAEKENRFLPSTFLKELGMPRPSAVEFYLQQPYHPNSRPSDQAKLVTYGDAAGYDAPGRLSGRKFYLDRKDAYDGTCPWKDDKESNRLNVRSTLALEASRSGSRFRFTLRFRDLDPLELSNILLALCPHQFREVVGGEHQDGYCSKLGYARPLGWGTVRMEAMELYFLKNGTDRYTLEKEPDLRSWFQRNFQKPPFLEQWLGVHRCKHPDAAGYPAGSDNQIYTFHTKLRADHSRFRRYERRSSS